MSDSDESRSFASMATDNEPAPPVVEKLEGSGSKIEEGYSLVILIKSLVMVEVPETDTRTLDISITLGGTETKLSGTMAEINEQRRGSAIRYMSNNSAFKLMCFTTRHFIQRSCFKCPGIQTIPDG